MEDYEKLYRIGTGGQGKVHRVKHRKSGKEFALKQIQCRDNYEMNFALHEIKVLTQIKHQYIISFHDFFIHRDRYQQISINLVMELCECGDLSDKIRDMRRGRRGRFDEPRIVKWTMQICQALCYLHEQDYIHRDIKPTNIFFTSSDSVRLGDFGLSRRCETQGRKTVVGTPYYFAPELMQHQRYTNKVDMWGMGVVVLELCTLRERPINSQLLQGPSVLAEAEAEIVSKGFSPRLAGLCRSLMSLNPEHRPTARDILRKWSPDLDIGHGAEKAGLPIPRPRSRSGGPALHVDTTERARKEPRHDAREQELMKQLAARDDELRALRLELERVKLVKHDDKKDDDVRRKPLGELAGNRRDRDQKKADKGDGLPPPPPPPRPAVVTPAWQKDGQRAGRLPRPATAEGVRVNDRPERDVGAATARVGGERAPREDAPVAPQPRAAFAAIADPACKLADLTGSSADASADDAPTIPQPRRNQQADGEIIVRAGESIQAAIEGCSSGSRIVIAPGLYTQALNVHKAVVLTAANGEDRPIIEVVNRTAVLVSAAAELHSLVIKQKRSGDAADAKWVACDFRQGAKGALMSKCDLSSEGGACLTVHSGADPTVRHSCIHDGAQAGIYMFDGAKGLIEHNDIRNNAYAALLLKRRADPVVRHNKIHSGADTGVFICQDSKGTIEENEIHSHGGSGVVVKGGGEPRISRNSIHSNKQAGVFVCDRGAGTIIDNDIARNLKAGVLIKTNANPIVEKNKIHSGKETGVYCFENGKGCIKDNVISGNQNAGVLVTSGGSLTVEGNTITANKYEGVWVCNKGSAQVSRNDLRGNLKGPVDVEDGSSVTMKDNVTGS